MQNFDVSLNSGTLHLNVETSDYPLGEICGFATRQNPKRGFLFVSKVLGKHYPVTPHKMQEIYDNLAKKIHINEGNSLFLGFAETATGLGAGVYSAWQKNHHNNLMAAYLQTTRYNFSQKALLNFQEEHSHATGHLLYANLKQSFFENLKTLVLIDDELTTGKTNQNFLNAFISTFKCKLEKVVLVSIKNWMSFENLNEFNKIFPFKVEFVSILKGNFTFEKNQEFFVSSTPNLDGTQLAKDHIISNNPLRFGYFNKEINCEKIIAEEKISLKKKTLVLGTGEFSYFPFLLAKKLEEKNSEVFYQSTTRSPILLGYDIKNKISFKDNYQDGIENYIYNVTPNQYEQVLICYETKEKFDCHLDEILNAKNIFMEKYL